MLYTDQNYYRARLSQATRLSTDRLHNIDIPQKAGRLRPRRTGGSRRASCGRVPGGTRRISTALCDGYVGVAPAAAIDTYARTLHE